MSSKIDENEILIEMDTGPGPSYEQLAEAWWAIHQALEIPQHPWKEQWQNRIFCDLLKQCGWTVEAWNDEVEWRKLVPIEEGEPEGPPPEKK